MEHLSRRTLYTVFGIIIGVVGGLSMRPFLPSGDSDDMFTKFREVLFRVENNYVDDVESQQLIDGAIAGMLEKLDPHSIYITAEEQLRVAEDFKGSFEGIGVEFDVINDSITVVAAISGGPAEKVGVVSGDRIVAIDGKNAVGLEASDVPTKLKGKKGTKVTVTVARPGHEETVDFTITRGEIPLHTVDASFVDKDGVGYIKINRFADPTYDEMMTHLRKLSKEGMTKLILDLRGNPGGYMNRAISMADEFIDGGKIIVGTKSSRSGEEKEFESSNGQNYEKIPLIVLVSPGSASAAEIVAGAIQDLDRGLIVGETTFGKGLVQQQFPLSDGSAFRLTVARYYTPSGRLIQRPYSEGNEAYFTLDRRDDAEGDNLNHELDGKDTTRPVFETLGGRKVIGGGGITPDYVVKPDTLDPKSGSWEILTRNVVLEYVEGYMLSEEKNLRARYGKTVETYLRDFAVTDEMFDTFLDLAETKGIEVNRATIAHDRPLLKNRIKARIARIIWGDNAFYRVALQADKQFLKALTLFGEAEKIQKMAR